MAVAESDFSETSELGEEQLNNIVNLSKADSTKPFTKWVITNKTANMDGQALNKIGRSIEFYQN